MRLPNGDQAVVDIAKLEEYCLNPGHPIGKHKAKVFASALGLRKGDAGSLREWLLEAARLGDAQAGMTDGFGRRYILDFAATHHEQTTVIRSCWILLSGEDFPRLTTCYVV
jgi:hypothetical protein